MNFNDRYPGRACTDCLMLIANGEGPNDLTEAELADYDRRVSETFSQYEVTLGHALEDHDGYHCPRKGGWSEWDDELDDYVEVAPDPDGECDCEVIPFGTMGCDVCGSPLAGEKHAVTFWPSHPRW